MSYVAVVAVLSSAGIPAADKVFHLVALTIALSMLAHSSTDIVVARSFESVDLTRTA